MKIFSTILMLFLLVSANAQTKIEYIEQQLTNLEMELKRHNPAWSLDNIQKTKLIQIFEEKYQKVNVILSSKMEKLEVSDKLTRIDQNTNPKYLPRSASNKGWPLTSRNQKLSWSKTNQGLFSYFQKTSNNNLLPIRIDGRNP
ncbi:MAG: hypothetical protein IPM26_06685 [Saprospiraceae bacterium]|nr:hypothetical protein [Saprospiraceae bacterium]